MDQDSIKLLTEIRNILDVIAFFVVVACIFWSIKSVTAVMANIKQAIKNRWEDVASKLHQAGSFEELKQHCIEKLENSPNDANANWYLGRYYYAMKELDQSKKHFNLAVEVYPTWEEDAQIYITKLEANGTNH